MTPRPLPPRLLTFIAAIALAPPLAAAADDAPAVPKGEVARSTFEDSKVFPRHGAYLLGYVPRQYHPAKPARRGFGQNRTTPRRATKPPGPCGHAQGIKT